MKRDSLRYYQCIKCGSSNLEIRTFDQRTENTEIQTGSIACLQCQTSYAITKGVPRFVGDDNYASSFGYQWTLHSKTQLDKYTGLSISRDRLWEVSRWPNNMSHELILEAGSGAGRFTEILAETGGTILSFDFSNAVDANYLNNGQHRNVHLFQGDIFRIPLPQKAFDKVLCLGVLQHTPDPEHAFKCLAQMVRPGGELVMDVYAKTVAAMLQWKYLLRPITVHVPPKVMYKVIAVVVPLLIPLARNLRRLAGNIGARLVPIVEYSHLGFHQSINREWAVLDTFDMYSPAHDHPQSFSAVSRWFKEAGFSEFEVRRGPNGFVGKGRAPSQ